MRYSSSIITCIGRWYSRTSSLLVTSLLRCLAHVNFPSRILARSYARAVIRPTETLLIAHGFDPSSEVVDAIGLLMLNKAVEHTFLGAQRAIRLMPKRR
jgi:hypothetical protein